MKEREVTTAEKLRKYAVPAIVFAVVLAAAFGIYRTISGDSPKKRVLDTVAIKLVPPPPPPPPKVEPPPPKTEEQKLEPPADKPVESAKNEPPPPLGVSEKGPGGDAAFNGDPNGTIGGGGSGDGSRWGHYSILVINSVSKAISNDEKLNTDKFRATVRVWVSDMGKVQRIQVLRSTGDANTTARLEQVVSAMPPLPEAPSKDMPQPIIVRVGAQPGMG